jgi:predicted  nucleic acid-binding Zn-ribbon protein
MLTNQVQQLERDRDRSATELKKAQEKVRRVQDQLADAQQEAEKARGEQAELRKEFDR